MKSSVQDLIQRVVIKTSFFPFSYFYRKIYGLSIAIATLWLRRVEGVLTIYLDRGVAKGEIVYGLSDIDLSVIVDDKIEEGKLAKEGVRATYDKVLRHIPLFVSRDKEQAVYSTSEFLNLYNDYDLYKYRFNNGKYTWKLLFGRDIVKALPQLEDSELYLSATEEYKIWWAFLNAEFTLDSISSLFNRKYLWYKAIAEASRIYLFVCHGEKVRTRQDALALVKKHLAYEQRCHIEKVQGYLGHLTAKEDLMADESVALFITLASKAFEEMERKVYDGLKRKKAILRVPSLHELMGERRLNSLIEGLGSTIERELSPYLDSIALIPQVEFGVDVHSNSDIDSFYLVLVQKSFMPVEKIREFRSFFAENSRVKDIEPFIVANGNIALSLLVNRTLHCIKSPGSSPLFFSLLAHCEFKPPEIALKEGDSTIYCYLPPSAFEERIKRRINRIDSMVLSKDIYKMKALDFLRFFWAAARTKLLARYLELDEIHIPLTSGQTLEMLLQFSPADSDWLNDLHREYEKELWGEENESYRFFAKSIELLKRV